MSVTTRSTVSVTTTTMAAPTPASFPPTLRGEHRYMVLYDTPHDRLRERLAEVCLDHGLYRIQQSCYLACIRQGVAQRLWCALWALVHAPLRRGDQTPGPHARLTMLRLDQGLLWPPVHISSPVAHLTPPLVALSPKSPSGYVVSATHHGAPVYVLQGQP